MKRPAWLALLFTYFILLVAAVPSESASHGDARQVRIVSVQGDVRLSPGDGKHTDLKKPWEQVLGGERMEQGFALASAEGRAEIEFENGATIFLAENSLLLFSELSAPSDGPVSRVTLATGSATFCVQLAGNERFFIDTPTEKMQLSAREVFFARVDAYLDATGLTAQGAKGEAMIRSGRPTFQLGNGQTVLFRGGEIIERLGPTSVAEEFANTHPGISAACAQVAEANLHEPPSGTWLGYKCRQLRPGPARTGNPTTADDWDRWVSQRVQEKSAVMTAALQASGLSSPVAGLADMYQHGNFFPCEPYGTCWEPKRTVLEQEAASQPKPIGAATQGAPPQEAGAANAAFQPQTVQWQQFWAMGCGWGQAMLVTRVAHTPQELQDLLRLKSLAERATRRGLYSLAECYRGNWITRGAHYVRVVTRPIPDKCPERKCKAEHPPHPVWVRAGGKVGLVPAHPQDVKGKPPINLRNGILVPAGKAGEAVEKVAIEPAEKIQVLSEAPKEYLGAAHAFALAAPAPKIQAHLMLETMRPGPPPGNPLNAEISFNYKTQQFMVRGVSNKGAKSAAVAVGGIASNGKVQSFADGRHWGYAQSFNRSSAAASYSGASRGSLSNAAGYSSSGAGHGSGAGSSLSSSSASRSASGGVSASSGAGSSSPSSGSSSSAGAGRSH